MAKAKAKVKKDEEVVIKSDPVLDNLASYIIEIFIKEDVNAFVEADLLHDLLVYKLDTDAAPIMDKIVRKMGEELKASGMLDLRKRIGGITQQKHVQFRNSDQYNAMIAIFFQAVDEKPEIVDILDDEQSFENFMILCINDYRKFWESFRERDRRRTDGPGAKEQAVREPEPGRRRLGRRAHLRRLRRRAARRAGRTRESLNVTGRLILFYLFVKSQLLFKSLRFETHGSHSYLCSKPGLHKPRVFERGFSIL